MAPHLKKPAAAGCLTRFPSLITQHKCIWQRLGFLVMKIQHHHPRPWQRNCAAPRTTPSSWFQSPLQPFTLWTSHRCKQVQIKTASKLSKEGGDWEAQCLLPASHPWPDSPTIDSSGHMWFVSNRCCLPASIDVDLFDQKVPRLFTRHTARLPPPLLRRAEGSLGHLLLHG